MKISCIQMDMIFCNPEENYRHAAELIETAMQEQPDVLVLPETWNTGFFPEENLPALCDKDGSKTKEIIGGLAKKYQVNIVAGSVSDFRNGAVYNTAYIFDRQGECVASYDKIHGFSPMGEHHSYTAGTQPCRFMLDGVLCGIIICYDLRFPELTRLLALEGIDVLFVVSQWPLPRAFHLRTLTTARAIENQMYLACCNSCGKAGSTVYGGGSVILGPLGETLAETGTTEAIISADCDTNSLQSLRSAIPVFTDRRSDLYTLTKEG